MNPEASFGQWLKQRRKSLDLTQAELAGRVGCATSMLQKIEASERRPSPEFAARLAEVLGIQPDQRPALVEFARTDRHPPSSSPTNLPAQVTPSSDARATPPRRANGCCAKTRACSPSSARRASARLGSHSESPRTCAIALTMECSLSR